jgi:hypothetical protein
MKTGVAMCYKRMVNSLLKKLIWLPVLKDLFIDSASSVTHIPRWPFARSADDKHIPPQRRAIFIPEERLD